MTYAQCCKRLKQTAAMGSRLGLESIRALCACLGNPQDALRIVHVAGTNGKGSVCAMTASILKAAGYKTGLYTSPFLKNYRDSFAVDGKSISPADFARVISQVFTQVDRLNEQGVFPTEFEILTAGAFVWFAAQACEAVVLETGLGGRLDATNVISHPLVSVITAVSMDHMDYLGSTLSQIAREKCGIIKPGGVTVSYPAQEAETLRIIEDATKAQGNPLVIPDAARIKNIRMQFDGTSLEYRGAAYQLGLNGRHQAFNAATAIETANVLRGNDQYMISDGHIAEGLRLAYVPARQEILARQPLVMLDGAHNPQGIEALADTLSAIKPRPLAVIMGILRDKEYEACIRVMASLADRFIAVRPPNPRVLAAAKTAAVAAQYCANTAAEKSYGKAVSDAALFCGQNGTIVICGSLYMADAMRRAVLKNNLIVKSPDR